MRRKPLILSLLALAGISAFVFVIELDAAKRSRRQSGIITKLSFDPSAEKVGFFNGEKAGKIGVKVIPKNEKGGRVLVQNKSDQPISVQVPPALVGVHVLSQFGGGGMGAMGGGGMGAMGGGGMGMGGGGQQSMGGGMGMGGGMMGGGGMGMGGGMGGGGGGFFSIPPASTVAVPYGSVCLNHGLPIPRPGSTYRLVPPENYTDDVELQELLTLIASGKVDQKSAQAAAWHITDDMSWQELANKSIKRLGGLPAQRYFSFAEIRRAQMMVAYAREKATARKKSDKSPGVSPEKAKDEFTAQ